MSHSVRGILTKRAQETFTLDAFVADASNQRALDAARKFELNPEKCNLFLYGPVGVGKTHLATAVSRHHNPIITTGTDLFRELRAATLDGPDEESRAISRCANISVLVIDDLGAGKFTDYAIGVLLEIIDRRWMDMRNGLVITGNLSLDDLAMKMGDDRLTSRLASMCRGNICELAGKDRRIDA